MNGFIYLMYVRKFLVQGLPIYKIGKTEDIIARYKQYPKGSVLIYSCYTDDISKTENEIKKQFSHNFVKHDNFVTESFV